MHKIWINKFWVLLRIEEQYKAIEIFQPIIKKIVEWSMSRKKAREVLVLYDRTASIMYLYSMKDVLKKLSYDITFTKQGGNMLIGNLITFKRKGGNGKSSNKPKTDPKHLGNNIQLQLKMKEFIKDMESIKLGQYTI